jgi:hypothetical protein
LSGTRTPATGDQPPTTMLRQPAETVA